LVAFGVAAVELGVGPFVGQGAMEALHFAVGLWPVRAGATTFDVAECVGERVRTRNRVPQTDLTPGSGPTTPKNGSTRRSGGAPTSSASSPTRGALIRHVGAVLAEQHDEWAESRRYLGLDVLSKSRADHSTPTEQEATPCGTNRLTYEVEESHDDLIHHVPGLDPAGLYQVSVNGNRNLISCRQSKIDQLGFIGRRP
jgi:hypothetical protein